MSIRRFLSRQFPLRSRIRGVAFIFVILLFSGCGGEETINNPVGGGDAIDIAPAPTSPHYFPMTLGNRWVYRNPDGSEWSREVTETQKFDTELYHSFNYDPPIQDNQLDSLGSAEYFTYADRLVRPIPHNDFNDAIWKIILDSGGETPEWGFGLHCNSDPDGLVVCHLDKASRIFNPPGILSMLFNANPHVASLSELTPLRFPLCPTSPTRRSN